MPIPSTIADLSTTAASNSPQGSDSPTEGDNYIRALSAIIAQEHADFLASSGSTKVGFLQDGTGATSRTAQAKMRDAVSVKDFGAVGDGTTDDTAAIQAALTAKSVAGGGVVVATQGKYRLTSKLTIPSYVLFMGQGWVPDPSNTAQASHTSLYIDWGSGANNHAVEMSHSSGIEGFTFYYPGQVAKSAATPTAFGYSISTPTGAGVYDNIHVRNITLYNSYRGIRLENGGRWRVENIQGNPLFVGITADSCFDACYMSNVHFWNFYTQSDTLETWVAANGTAFLLNRIDQLFGNGLFGWNYNVCFDLGSSFWGSLSNILVDKADIPIRLTSVSQAQFSNFVLICSVAAKPAIHMVSGNGGVRFSNGKITSAASVGAQIDGGDKVSFNNVGFENQHSAVVVTNTTTDVQVNNCTWAVPPFGTSNVKINGIPLPAKSTSVTLPAPTASPTGISGGYRFDLSTGGAKVLQYDVGAIAQKNSLHILEFDYLLNGSSSTWYFQFNVDKDVGGQLQVSFSPTYPLMLNSTSKTVRIPFFINGAQFKTLLSIVITPTVTVASASVDITNIVLYEASNASMSDSQVSAMITNGYNLDFYGVGRSLKTNGKNRIVYPVLDAGVGRTTEVPTAGTWLQGDKIVVLAPTTVAGSYKLCSVAGTPGTWV